MGDAKKIQSLIKEPNTIKDLESNVRLLSIDILDWIELQEYENALVIINRLNDELIQLIKHQTI